MESQYANTAPVSEDDRILLETVTGRLLSTETNTNVSAAVEDIREKSVGSRPVDDKTDKPLSGSTETVDGLDETDEMIRHMAEDTPNDDYSEREADLPVFDRGETI